MPGAQRGRAGGWLAFLMGGSEAEVAFFVADVAAVGDDEVVEEVHAEEVAGGLEDVGGVDVVGGGGGIAAGCLAPTDGL